MKEIKFIDADDYLMKAELEDDFDIVEVMIEFAKIHVKQALESAALNAEIKEDVNYLFAGKIVCVDSILNSYPEELIK